MEMNPAVIEKIVNNTEMIDLTENFFNDFVRTANGILVPKKGMVYFRGSGTHYESSRISIQFHRANYPTHSFEATFKSGEHDGTVRLQRPTDSTGLMRFGNFRDVALYVEIYSEASKNVYSRHLFVKQFYADLKN